MEDAVAAPRPGRPQPVALVFFVLAGISGLAGYAFMFSPTSGARNVPVAVVGLSSCLILIAGGLQLRRDGRSLEDGMTLVREWDWTDIVLFPPAFFAAALVAASVLFSVVDGLGSQFNAANRRTLLPALENTATEAAIYGAALIIILLLVVVRRGGRVRDLGWRLPVSRWWFAAAFIGVAANDPGGLFGVVGGNAGVAVAIIYIVVDRCLDRRPRPPWVWGAVAAATALLIVGLSLLDNWLAAHMQDQALAQCTSLQQEFNGVAALAIIAVAIIAPIVEETLFRGFLYGWLRRKMPVAAAALLSGIVFGLSHANVVILIPLSIFGVMLALIAERSRSTVTTMVVHAAFNLVGIIGFLSVTSCHA